MTRKEAMALGVTHYDNGKPCKAGHDPCFRFSTSGSCVQCVRIAKLARIASAPEREKERRAAEYARHLADIRGRSKQWYHSNRDKALAYRVEWRKKNVQVRRVYSTNYRARKNASEGSHTKDQVADLFNAQGGKCIYCLRKLGSRYHADHIVPLALGGTNWISNIQLTCKSCNSSKGAKHPIAFAQERGRLL